MKLDKNDNVSISEPLDSSSPNPPKNGDLKKNNVRNESKDSDNYSMDDTTDTISQIDSNVGKDRERGDPDADSNFRVPMPKRTLLPLSVLFENYDETVYSRRPDFAINFLEEVDQDNECPICGQIYWFPVLLAECHHNCCYQCYKQLIRVGSKCPLDGEHISNDNVTFDKDIYDLVASLKVDCTYIDLKCVWKGQLDGLCGHVEECDFAPMKCPKCSTSVQRAKFETHLFHECKKRLVTCQLCNGQVRADEEEKHMKSCLESPADCPNKCGVKNIKRNQLDDHKAFDCQKQEVDCPFVLSGCVFKALRNQISKHLKDSPDIHLNNMLETVKLSGESLAQNRLSLDSQSETLVDVETKVMSLEKLYGAQLVWKIDDFAEKLQDAKAGRKPYIYSQPFLSSRYGYKMALSACLNGEGVNKGTAMSIFVCICQGDFDALLEWPFRHRIDFTLLDQNPVPELRRDVSNYVKPNICKENLVFLSKPKMERNSSFGLQKFVDLGLLNTRDYARDNTVYVKVDVDSERMDIL